MVLRVSQRYLSMLLPWQGSVHRWLRQLTLIDVRCAKNAFSNAKMRGTTRPLPVM